MKHTVLIIVVAHFCACNTTRWRLFLCVF